MTPGENAAGSSMNFFRLRLLPGRAMTASSFSPLAIAEVICDSLQNCRNSIAPIYLRFVLSKFS